jgi:hypothetical protein
MPGPSTAPGPSRRQQVAAAYHKAKKQGVSEAEIDEGVRRALPDMNEALIANTLRILRIIEVSGQRSVPAIRRWQKEHDGRQPKQLTDGFSTEGCQELLDALGVAVAETAGREDHIDSQSEAEGGETDQGEEAGVRGHAITRYEAIDLPKLWEQIETAAERAAERARQDERRVADAQLEAERQKVLAERQLAATIIETERKQGVERSAAQRAHARLVAVVVGMLALAAGVAGGVAWSHHGLLIGGQPTGNPQQEPAAVTPLPDHKAEPTVAPKPSLPSVTEGGAMPAPTPVTEGGAIPTAGEPATSKP